MDLFYEMVIIIAAVAIEHGQQAIVQPLEGLIGAYIGYITFGLDIAAGLVIAISAAIALIAFLKILRKSPKEQTEIKRLLDYVWQEDYYWR
jgi:hypothetical protein